MCPTTTSAPSAEKSTSFAIGCASSSTQRSQRRRPVRSSHTATVPSLATVPSQAPSALNATELTENAPTAVNALAPSGDRRCMPAGVCDRSRSTAPVRASMMRATPSLPPAAMRSPAG